MTTSSSMGRGIYFLNRLAASPMLDRWGLRKPLEKVIYVGVKNGFKLIGATARAFSPKKKLKDPTRLPKPGERRDLFDLTPTEEQQMLRDSVQRFAKDLVRPAAHQADAEAQVPAALSEAAQELGLAMYAVPEALDGAATEDTIVSHVFICEDMAYGDMGLAVALLTPIHVANALARWGSAEQQDKYLTEFAGDKPPVGTFAINEPAPLFDPMALSTTATLQGDHYVLQGQKSLVPLAQQAELFLVAAQTPQGPGIFIVEAGIPGLELVQEGSMGLKAAQMASLVLNQVKVPATNRFSAPGFDYTAFIDQGVLAWCALAVGTCQAVLDYVIPACNDRVAFGEPISHRQAVAFMIANIAVELDAMRLMTLRAAARAEQGLSYHRETYLARVLVAEKAMKIGTDGVQLLGGHGFTKEHPVERWYRDLRATSIMYGLHA